MFYTKYFVFGRLQMFRVRIVRSCHEDLSLVLLMYVPWKPLCVISLEHDFRAALVDEGKMMVLKVFLLKSSLQWSLIGPYLSCVGQSHACHMT